MDVYKLLLDILEKPDASKFYKNLRDYYQYIGLSQEASAISFLIEKKFEKNITIDNSDAGQEQREDS